MGKKPHDSLGLLAGESKPDVSPLVVAAVARHVAEVELELPGATVDHDLLRHPAVAR